MGRKKSAIPRRRQRVSRHSNSVGRHRLRVRQLLARRTRLRSYLQHFPMDEKANIEAVPEKKGAEVTE
ncbi:hypothetical protein [Microbulbifer sp. CNSA002]|uniref:hypothetical protein n=1 Tax=unclassified Microbulbifer TaxID=2619833 RepID=UPI0039B4A67E